MSSSTLENLFERNREWASRMECDRPGFFRRLMQQQRPRYMWIGCSDSRVPANQITGLEPGEVFVHRNVANVVVPTDLNCISTIQFAVDQLKVEHVMVVGHYGCGGVLAALEDRRIGLADSWLQHVRDVRNRHAELLKGLPTEDRHAALCELNVIEQVFNVANTTVIRDAWSRGQQLALPRGGCMPYRMDCCATCTLAWQVSTNLWPSVTAQLRRRAGHALPTMAGHPLPDELAQGEA